MSSESSAPAQTSSEIPTNNKKMNPISIIVLVIIAIIAVAAYFFMNSKKNEGATVQTSQQQELQQAKTNTEASPGSVSAGDAMTVKIEAGSFYFKPNVIKAKLGQTVRVELSVVSLAA